ncbi:MAG TPA: lytic murein transglycosylase B [Cellvibrionaceae bacterium]
MSNIKMKVWVFLVSLLVSQLSYAVGEYAQHPLALAFIDKMVAQHHFDRKQLLALFAKAEKKQSILDAIARPAEKVKPWYEYRKIFITKERVEQGVQFWRENQAVLTEVERNYQVNAKMIVAIIGVETGYGRNTGKYRVIDALSTLSFDYPPRADFFIKELEAFLLLSKQQHQDPLSLNGSYAGAMGYGQFMPSSVRNFAVDNNGDGVVDIWTNKGDAIASVANYFKANGWQYRAPVFTLAKKSSAFDVQLLNTKAKPSRSLNELRGLGISPLSGSYPASLTAEALSYELENGPEYWLGFTNYYVITRYNRSQMYALAAWQLGEAIEQAKLK